MKHDDDMTFSPDELDTLNIWQQKEEFYDQGVSTTEVWQTGWSEGWQDGARDQTRKIVQNLLKLGVATDIIAQAAEWSPGDVEAERASLKK